MERKTVIELANNVITEYPQLKDDVKMYVQLAKDEIDEGGSPTHEWELAYDSIKELVLEHIKKENNESIY